MNSTKRSQKQLIRQGEMPHIAVFGLKGLPAIGGTAAVGENLVQNLNTHYRFTIYATASHASNMEPYPHVKQYIFKKFLPHKLNVFYYNLMAAIHAVLFGHYDLVHTHQIDTGFIVPLLRLRYKVVSTHHGKTYQMSKWSKGMQYFFRMTERLMVKWANMVTFVAESERFDAYRKFGKQFLTINNGFTPQPISEQVGGSDDYIMFAAGRIIPHKGCHVFLEALKNLNYKGKVIIAGDYQQLSDYEDQLMAYEVDLDIDFLGMVKDRNRLLAYVKNAKFFVFPSFYEAMSMMLLEVASVKTPLICSDIIENKQVFGDQEVQFFKSGDTHDLALKISTCLSSPGELERKANVAYRKLLSQYQWPKIARQYQNVYQQLLS